LFSFAYLSSKLYARKEKQSKLDSKWFKSLDKINNSQDYVKVKSSTKCQEDEQAFME